MCGCTPEQIMQVREQATKDIEKMAVIYCISGEADRWFSGTDDLVRRISQTVNGPALEKLAADTKFVDSGCINMFRCGGDFLGKLPCMGLDVPSELEAHDSIAQLHDTCGGEI